MNTAFLERPLALLLTDTDKTQQYVFEVNELPEIWGG